MSKDDKKGTILIMDDEDMVCEIAEQIFDYLEYDVVTTKDGAEAISVYQERLEQGMPFDMVVMDLNIPGGIGGKEAVKDILAIDPNAKVVVSSGYSTDPLMVNYAENGFVGVLAKPFEVAVVETLLKDVLG